MNTAAARVRYGQVAVGLMGVLSYSPYHPAAEFDGSREGQFDHPRNGWSLSRGSGLEREAEIAVVF